jgi:colanic acid biosynthesis protein WcaH
LKNSSAGYIEGDVFKTVIENTPLVSVDLIVKDRGRVLLGKRVNKPAQGTWFTLGGRVLKNEMINSAIRRIAKTELGIELTAEPKFIGVFEHLYDDGIFDHVSTHYLNLGYEVELSGIEALPKEQHDDYRWFGLVELLQSDAVHDYVKDYFTTQKGTVPQ